MQERTAVQEGRAGRVAEMKVELGRLEAELAEAVALKESWETWRRWQEDLDRIHQNPNRRPDLSSNIGNRFNNLQLVKFNLRSTICKFNLIYPNGNLDSRF